MSDQTVTTNLKDIPPMINIYLPNGELNSGVYGKSNHIGQLKILSYQKIILIQWMDMLHYIRWSEL